MLLLILCLAGIPTIIRPFFGDQLFWADRVEALGVGAAVRKLTVNALTDALRAATTDAKQIARARLLGEQIRAVRILLFPSSLLSSYSGRKMVLPQPSNPFIGTWNMRDH